VVENLEERKILDGFIWMLSDLSARAVATSTAENLQRKPYPLSWKNVKLIFYSGMTNKDQEMAHLRCQFP
jgi:hypothetical protein